MLIRSDAAPSYGEFKIFPYWTIEGSSGGEESSTALFEALGAETRYERWGEDRQRISLDKATLTYDGNRVVRAFRRAIRGMAKLFLFRDIRECWMGKPNPHGFDLPPAKWEYLGVGDGVKTQFQLRLWEEVQGEEVIRNVYFPNHAYPNIEEDGNVKFTTERLRIKLGGNSKNGGAETTAWAVNRINSGVVVFDVAPAVGVSVWAYGSFFVVVRCNQDIIKTKPLNGGTHFQMDGTEFIEPKGRK